MLNLKIPPQLLINLMYLVFTGLLSLNVSNNYIKRLSLFEQNFKTSNRIIDITNTRIQKLIEEASSPKYQPVIETAKNIRSISARFTAYIEYLRGEVLGTNVEYSVSSQGDGWWSNTYRTEKTISWERETDLETEIKETRAEMLKVMRDLLSKMGNIGQDPNVFLSYLDETMPLGADDNYKNVVLPFLSKYINDAKISEAACLNALVGLISVGCGISAFVPVSSPIKTYVIEGEDFETDINIGASSLFMPSNYSISVNGSSVPVVDGIAHYKTSASGVGEKSYKVVLDPRSVTTGERYVSARDFKYNVVRPIVRIELENMNMVYIGVDNHLTISAPGVSSNHISCSAIGGGISLVPAGDFKYIVRAINPTDDASIVLNIDGKHYTQKVIVKNIPNPVAKLGTQYTGGDISSQDFKMQKGFKAVLENFDFDAKCEVVSFGMIRIPKRANAQKVSNSGSEFGRSAAALITAAMPDDIYLFQNIKAKCLGDKAARDIGSMNFTIK